MELIPLRNTKGDIGDVPRDIWNAMRVQYCKEMERFYWRDLISILHNTVVIRNIDLVRNITFCYMVLCCLLTPTIHKLLSASKANIFRTKVVVIFLGITRGKHHVIPRHCYQVQPSIRGTMIIYHQGYSYGAIKVAKYPHKYWRCTCQCSQKCKATAILNTDGSLILKGDHTHLPKIDFINQGTDQKGFLSPSPVNRSSLL